MDFSNKTIGARLRDISITAAGGYEDGYADLVAFDNNCEYSFTCDSLSQNQIVEFIESCYVK